MCQNSLKENKPGVWAPIIFIADWPKAVSGLFISLVKPVGDILQMVAWGRMVAGSRWTSPSTLTHLCPAPQPRWGKDGWGQPVCWDHVWCISMGQVHPQGKGDTEHFRKAPSSVLSTWSKGFWGHGAPQRAHRTPTRQEKGERVEAGEKGASCFMYEKICQAPMVRFNSWVLCALENNVIYVIPANGLV